MNKGVQQTEDAQNKHILTLSDSDQLTTPCHAIVAPQIAWWAVMFFYLFLWINRYGGRVRSYQLSPVDGGEEQFRDDIATNLKVTWSVPYEVFFPSICKILVCSIILIICIPFMLPLMNLTSFWLTLYISYILWIVPIYHKLLGHFISIISILGYYYHFLFVLFLFSIAELNISK